MKLEIAEVFRSRIRAIKILSDLRELGHKIDMVGVIGGSGTDCLTRVFVFVQA